jgi:hypothetical protein
MQGRSVEGRSSDGVTAKCRRKNRLQTKQTSYSRPHGAEGTSEWAQIGTGRDRSRDRSCGRSGSLDPCDHSIRATFKELELPGSPERAALAQALERASRSVHAGIEATLRPYELSRARFELLQRLLTRPEGEQLGKLGGMLFVHPTTMTKLVDRLNAAGFIERRAVEEPGLSKVVQSRILGRVSEDAVDFPGRVHRRQSPLVVRCVLPSTGLQHQGEVLLESPDAEPRFVQVVRAMPGAYPVAASNRSMAP